MATTAIPQPFEALTHNLIDFSRGITWEKLPQQTRASTQRHVIDTLGVMIAGSGEQVLGAAASVLRAQHAPGAYIVPGHTAGFDALSATYLGAVAGHSLELDDGYRLGSTHPGTVVVPTALVGARMQNANTQEMLAAVAAGYEVQTLIARVVHPALRNQGFHSTAVVGVFAAAATAAHLLRLTSAQWQNAFGIAASSAAGLFAFINGGGDIKRLHPGHSAREGLFAALLAQKDVLGPPAVLENRDGFFQGFAQAMNDKPIAPDKLAFYPDRPYGIDDCYIKPFPCCRHLHPALEALLDIITEHAIAPEDVTRIEVTTYDIAARHGDIGAGDFASAQLSFRYVLAVGLRFGTVAIEHFSDSARQDTDTLALQNLVHIKTSDQMNADYRASGRPAEVRMITPKSSHTQTVLHPLGSPAAPLNAEQCRTKFIDLVSSRLGSERATTLWSHCEQLDSIEDIGSLLELTRP